MIEIHLSSIGDAVVEQAGYQDQQAPMANSEVTQCPALNLNVQLVGPLQGSGFREQQWLIQRDGRFIQLTELLYRIAECANGERTLQDIAATVTGSTDWMVSADNVRHLIQTKLIPLGIIATTDDAVGISVDVHRGGSPLAVNLRAKMISPGIIDPITRVLQILYSPVLLVPLLGVIAVAHWWLYFDHGIARSLRDSLYTPGALPMVLGLLLAASIFHEFGHAAALRYGGGKVRGMGVGIYLIYPAFYTDVTDSYRLNRWSRVRTDLGGFYFHLIFTLGIMALSQYSGWEFLLFAAVLINFDILRQTLPFVRLDGYWALADLTGIPDFFSQMGPFLRNILRLPGGNRLPNLKPWVTAVFAIYTVFTIPVLAIIMFFLIRRLPRLVVSIWDALRTHTEGLSRAQIEGDFLGMIASASQMLLLALPLVGIGVFLYNLTWRPLRGIWGWSKRSPSHRFAVGLITAGGIAFAVSLWVSQPPSGGEAGPVGVQSFGVTERTHIDVPVAYEQLPPVGGNHAPIWQNCGFYDAPIANENGAHSLEHGAVWLTYRPDLPAEQVDALRRLTKGQTHVLVSPYPNLLAPVVASAWDRQLLLDSADDARIEQFVRAFQRGSQAPEAGAPCTGGIGQPT